MRLRKITCAAVAAAALAAGAVGGASSASADAATDAKVIQIVKNKLGVNEVYRMPNPITAFTATVQPAVVSSGRVYSLTANIEGGKAAIAVLQDPGTTRATWRFSFQAGQKLEVQDDGAALIVGADSDTSPSAVEQIVIGKPWAKDINGRNLPTSYSISANSNTQTVVTTGATYPSSSTRASPASATTGVARRSSTCSSASPRRSPSATRLQLEQPLRPAQPAV